MRALLRPLVGRPRPQSLRVPIPLRELETLGHRIALWVDDLKGRYAGETEAETEVLMQSFFGPFRVRVRRDQAGFAGAGVAMATGWQERRRVGGLRLAGERS